MRRWGWLPIVVALSACLAVPVARAEVSPAPARVCDPQLQTLKIPNARTAPKVFAWNSNFASQPVRFWSRTCADLAGTLFWPASMPATGSLPGVLVFPPSSGAADKSQVAYVARNLASNGYIAFSPDAQGIGDSGLLSSPVCGTKPGRSNPSPCPGVPYQSTDNWMSMAHSALDWFVSAGNPLVDRLDAAHIGTVGHSMGARVASYLQDPVYDRGRGTAPRIAAVVGLDNLSSNYYGDKSASGNENLTSLVVGQPLPGSDPIAISAPGLGLASDNAFNKDATLKKFAWKQWRAAGVPSGMLVFAGVDHLSFSQTAASDEALLHRFADYTLAWLDRFLKGDESAVARIVARDAAQLSTTQRSAMYLPDVGIDCGDWRRGC